MRTSNVYNCDCLEYLRKQPDNAFDLAVVDPPYGSPTGIWRRKERFGQRFDRYRKKSAPGDDPRPIEWDIAPDEEYFKELFRVSKNQIIWGGNYFSLPPTRCFLVWRKTTISEAFTMAMAEYAWTSFDSNAKVFEFAPQDKTGDRFHPTAKPVELYAWIYRLYAKPGMKILDTHMGSQSSRIAAFFANLDYTGCEIDKEYFDRGNERFERVCHGIMNVGGTTIIQRTLFD